jgi:hypothetical protein
MQLSPKPSAPTQRTALLCYALATAIGAVGIQFAAVRFPGSFDWAYTVISALASRKHNPEGAAWFAGAIAGSMLCLWPVITRLTQSEFAGPSSPRWVSVALRVGVVCGIFVGVERLAFYHFSTFVRKGHEIVALVAFLSFYAGILGLYTHRVRLRRMFLFPALAVVTPLLGVGFRELFLYVTQRDVGWADYDWQGQGTPLWLSFAWWQWLAASLLWISIGHLVLTVQSSKAPKG